jgi:hypothetical protein
MYLDHDNAVYNIGHAERPALFPQGGESRPLLATTFPLGNILSVQVWPF